MPIPLIIIANPPILKLRRCHFLIKGITDAFKPQLPVAQERFSPADQQVTAVAQGAVELAVEFVLGFFGKIDHHIPAEDQVKTYGERIQQQVVVLEINPVFYLRQQKSTRLNSSHVRISYA